MSWTTCIERHDTVDSTMRVAATLADRGAREGTTVVARAQTAGRGRHGRRWHSPTGAGLWLTTIVRPHPGTPAHLATLSLVGGIAAWRALRALGVADVRVKWPNDLVVHARKLWRVLLEMRPDVERAPCVLIGMGINVAARAALSLPDDVSPLYVGLVDCLRKDGSGPDALLEQTLCTLLPELEACYHRWQAEGLADVLAEWQEADALAGVRVRIDDGAQTRVGIADGISAHGELRVRIGGQTVLVGAGEVVQVRGREEDCQ